MELSGDNGERLSQNSQMEEANLNNLDEAAEPNKNTKRNAGYAIGRFAACLKKKKITIDLSEMFPEEFGPTLMRYYGELKTSVVLSSKKTPAPATRNCLRLAFNATSPKVDAIQ